MFESLFAVFYFLFSLVMLILSIALIVRFWKLTNDVKEIKERLTSKDPKITYLVAVGEKKQAQKAALAMLVDSLHEIYVQGYTSPAEEMNEYLKKRLPKIKRLGIEVPDYVTSGEKFIDYFNGLTGNNVPYKYKS